MRAEDFGAPLTLVEGEDGLGSPPMAAPACEPRDWRSLYEQAYARAEKGRARADTAQAEPQCRGGAQAVRRGHARYGHRLRPLQRLQTAVMYSVIATLSLNGIDVLRWLQAWLAACTDNGGRPPHDLSPWLPWSMSEDRKRTFMTPR